MATPGFESVETLVEEQLDAAATELEDVFGADAIAIYGPITPGLDAIVRDSIESRTDRRTRLCVVLQTPGGAVELAERVVNILRHHYAEVAFIVPDRAMSAGTVLVMSGDEIWMDYFSCLGPIDPQVLSAKQEKFVPALGYLSQFQRLIEKSREGELTDAELILLQKLDLAELHFYEEARLLTHELLVRWLVKYKFKRWEKTEDRGIPVTEETRRQRALDIAKKLSDNELWHSHSRGIPMQSLVDELNLRISDFGQNKRMRDAVRRYHKLMGENLRVLNIGGFVHMRRTA